MDGLLAVYVDDTLAAGTSSFEKLTDKIPQEFESKPKEHPPLLFAGININKLEDGYFLEQADYISKIDLLKPDTEFDEFRTTRHKLAWVSHTRPEILAGVNILSQVTNETYQKEDLRIINSLIKHLKKYPDLGLKYRKINMDTTEILVFSDGSFSGNNDRSSQVGYIIMLADNENNGNIIDYSSTKSRRVVRSVLGAETFGMADACDAAIVIQHDMKKILKRTFKIKLLTDSETLFNVVIRNASTTERRLMIDIKAAREAYNEGTINDVVWIRRDYNLADAMTKYKILPQLVEFLQTGKVRYEVEQSVLRTAGVTSENKLSKEDQVPRKEEKDECEN